ncbi:MAG: flagellar basal-body MS-ring/collar protein FliF [Bacillota bacterium]|nr:flagellar basal-body MS-ring/collar protein FliF [Bacillota bacterium]
MSLSVRGMGDQLKAFWGRLERPQRWLLAAVGVLALAAVVAVGLLGHRGPAMAPLFSRLQAQDAAAIVQQLQSQGVPYQLADQGQTILVPADQVYKLRLDMAAKGLPSSGVVGFESMNSLPLGSTSFQQQVAYLRALEGELTRTILQINGVAGARVHINLPQQSVFVSQQQPASAAVMVEMAPGQLLEPDQVAGIRHLVAASVPDLKPEDVVIVDQYGRSLDAGSGGQASAGPAGYAQQRAFEQDLQQSVTSLLQQVFGSTPVAVRVSASLDMDQRTIQNDTYSQPAGASANGGLAQSVHQLQEQFSGTGMPPGGLAGSASNLPPGASVPTYPAAGNGGTSTYTQTDTTTDYLVNHIQEQIKVAPGAIQRLSVAVVVGTNLTPAQQQAVQQVVEAAVGANAQRGDVVTVLGMPFRSVKPAAPRQAAAPRPTLLEPPYVYALAGALLLLLVLGAALLRAAAARRRAQARLEEMQALLARRPETTTAQPAAAVPAEPPRDGKAALERARRLALADPETAANVIRSWLSDN